MRWLLGSVAFLSANLLVAMVKEVVHTRRVARWKETEDE